MKSGNLNFLEPSGPLQACNGTASPFFTVVTLLAVVRFQKYKAYEEVYFSLFTDNLGRVQSHSSSTVRRTDFSHCSCAYLHETLEGHHVSWLQAATERTPVCVAHCEPNQNTVQHRILTLYCGSD